MALERFTSRMIRMLLSLLVLLALLAGCGGGGGSSTSTSPSTGAGIFTPNYVSALEGLYHWDHLPVRIGFSLPSDWSSIYTADPDLHIDASNHWNQSGLHALTAVVAVSQADVVVTFVTQSQLGGNIQGITHYTYDSTGRMRSASIKVALDDGRGSRLAVGDIRTIIAHEIGHSLGISGHSPYGADLLFATHTMGVSKVASTQDLNTAMSAYPAYFGRSIPLDRGIETQGTPEIYSGVIE